ncbi:MAG: sugar transferase [Gammaproteobacteria bacterium]|nr:sugar transferase [Gammaproteobacteria bacterium]
MSKRLFDVVLSAIGIIVLAPLFLLASVWIKLDSPGPVFFRQERVGLRGKPFMLLKFRSMVTDAPQKGPAITVGADPRITRSGAILRRTKFDEFPQLFNVLAGDMSLVGPRPELPRYVALYPPEVRDKILSVRPGITDQAAIEFADEATLLGEAEDSETMYVKEILPRKVELYGSYVDEHSVIGDLRIILQTFARIASLGR